MDKKAANNLLVGVVVTLGFFAFVFILFNIGGGTGFLTSKYTLFGKFKDVKGLHSGSEVSLSGLRVGVIKDIAISDGMEKELIIEISITNSIQDRIRQDSVAMIKTQGVLGDKYIEISIGSPSLPVLKEGEFITTSEGEDLFQKGGDLVQNIGKHFSEGGDFNELIKNLNTLIANLNNLSNTIKTQHGLLNAMFYGSSGTKLDKSLAHLEGIFKKIDKGEGSLGALINDPTIYEDLKSLFGGAKRSNILKYFMRQFIEDGTDEGDRSESE